jgi:hypothetical protein
MFFTAEALRREEIFLVDFSTSLRLRDFAVICYSYYNVKRKVPVLSILFTAETLRHKEFFLVDFSISLRLRDFAVPFYSH